MSSYNEAIQVMSEQFGKDTFLLLATTDDKQPSVRVVNSYYEDGAFYVVTYALTNKMKQIKANPNVAVYCNDWFSPFTARGFGENLGWVRDERNAAIMTKLRDVFSVWYTEAGHINEDDPNTCLLRIRLIDGMLHYNNKQYTIDFINRTA